MYELPYWGIYMKLAHLTEWVELEIAVSGSTSCYIKLSVLKLLSINAPSIGRVHPSCILPSIKPKGSDSRAALLGCHSHRARDWKVPIDECRKSSHRDQRPTYVLCTSLLDRPEPLKRTLHIAQQEHLGPLMVAVGFSALCP